jgi:hypothetical protein
MFSAEKRPKKLQITKRANGRVSGVRKENSVFLK